MSWDGATNEPNVVDKYANYNEPEEVGADAERDRKSRRKTLVMLALCTFFLGLDTSLYSPYFPQQAQEKGLAPHDFGLVFGSYHLTKFFFVPVIGMWVQAVSANFILGVGMFTVGASSVLFGVLKLCPAGTPFTSLVFAVRVLDGFGAASVQAAVFAIAASQRPTAKLWATIVQLEICFSLGMAVGPAIGGVLYDFFDFSLPFYSYGSLSILIAIFTLIVMPKPSEIRVKVTKEFWSVFKLLGNWVYFFVVFSASYYSALLEATLRPHLKQFQLREAYVGLVFLTSSAVQAATAYGWKIAVKTWFNHVMLIVISCAAISASTVLVSPENFSSHPSIAYIVFGLALNGLGQSIKSICSYYGAYSDSLSRGFPHGVYTHSLVFEMCVFAATFGSWVGAFSSGYMYERIGFRYSVMVPLGMEIILVPFLLTYAFWRNYKKPVLLYTAEEQQPLLPGSTS